MAMVRGWVLGTTMASPPPSDSMRENGVHGPGAMGPAAWWPHELHLPLNKLLSGVYSRPLAPAKLAEYAANLGIMPSIFS